MFCCKFRSWNDAYTCSIFLNSTVWRGFWVLDGTGIWIAIWSFLLLQNLTSVLRKTADVTISDNSELDLLRWELTRPHVHFREVPSLTDTYEDTVPMKQDSCTGDYIRTAHRETPIHPHTQVLCSSLWYRHTAPSPSLSLSLSLFQIISAVCSVFQWGFKFQASMLNILRTLCCLGCVLFISLITSQPCHQHLGDFSYYKQPWRWSLTTAWQMAHQGRYFVKQRI